MKSRWLGVAVIAAMWAFAATAFGRLPAEIATHWGLSGQPDGWSPRWPGAFIAPIAATLLYLLLLGLPLIDPRRRNLERTGENRILIANLVVLFMALLEGITLGAALGWPVDVATGVTGGIGLLFVAMGNYLPRVRSNWWIGIRTPWTMDSERVWRETHRVGGRIFVVGGVLLLLAALVPRPWRDPLSLGLIVMIALVPVVYSFLVWRREASGRP